jgi:hypothetical protein
MANTEGSLGDAAIDGLLAGAGAGVLMGLYLLATGLAAGVPPLALLAHFDPGLSRSPLTGAVTHLAVSSVYGLAFGLGHRLLARLWRRLPGALLGLAYGAVLWLLAIAITGVQYDPAASRWLSGIAPLHFAVGHLLYGALLGWLLGRAAR